MPYTLDELNDLPQDEVLQILCEAHGTALSRSERAAMVRDNCQAKDAIAMIERVSGCTNREARESFAQGLEHGMLRPPGMTAAQAQELAAFIRQDA